MRFYQIQEQLEKLDELRMGASDFKKFLETPLAKSMRAGFEAEVVFKDVASQPDRDDYYLEPDYEVDRRTRSIEDIVDFFEGGDLGLSSREADNLRDRLTDDYLEYDSELMMETFYEEIDDLIRTHLSDETEKDFVEEWLENEAELSENEIEDLFELQKQYRRLYSTKEQRNFIDEHPKFQKYLDAVEEFETSIESRIQDAIDNQDELYETVLEDWQNNWDGTDEEIWLSRRGFRSMSDIESEFDLSWPYLTGYNDDEGGWNESVADALADSLSSTLGVETKVSGGYHSARRDDKTWIFEPDSSLEGDDSSDMPVEIISPPMPFDKTVEILPKFFKWLSDNDGYTNKSTGFHMSVSMPDHVDDNLDFVKLSLFLGDEYVLKQFGREANQYTTSALEKIRASTIRDPKKVAEYMDKMKQGLNEIAKNNLAKSHGLGKYTSINPKNGYVEFRSAGGRDYSTDIKRLQDTLTRYGMALTVAMDPNSERQEYAKKLYKLLSTGVKTDDDVISIFSRYVAKELPISELKSRLKTLQFQRIGNKPDSEDVSKSKERARERLGSVMTQNGNYEIYSRSTRNTIFPFSAVSPDEAVEIFNLWKFATMSPGLDPSNYGVRTSSRVRSTSSRDSSEQSTDELYPFMVTWSSSGQGGRSNYRVNATDIDAARDEFLTLARAAGIRQAQVHSVERL
jgi:hypothetical protein